MDGIIKRLRQLRIESGISQSAMAEMLGISRSLYALIETGKRYASIELEERIISRFPSLSESGIAESLADPGMSYQSVKLGEANLAALFGEVDKGKDVVLSFAGRHYRILPAESATERALTELCGTWEDGRTADEMISFLRESRSQVRKAIEL
ncbi:MAG: helix-turn-helix transcriptional regulator [Bacteroidales bacterium]|nr:helix-turn-helix transcriptional regulator [Bacteroidales bacterium]